VKDDRLLADSAVATLAPMIWKLFDALRGASWNTAATNSVRRNLPLLVSP
jgi:hypothetical protein